MRQALVDVQEERVNIANRTEHVLASGSIDLRTAADLADYVAELCLLSRQLAAWAAVLKCCRRESERLHDLATAYRSLEGRLKELRNDLQRNASEESVGR